MEKRTYQVESPVKHDGKDYGVGAQIDLEDSEATALLDVKAITAASAVANSGHSAPADEDERIAAIVDAIGQMDAKDAALWVKNGTPKTDAIASITGWPVSGKERDAAWAEMSK